MKQLHILIIAAIFVLIIGAATPIFAVTPDAVQSLRSVSHVINSPTQTSTVQMSWRPPENTTDIRGYYTLFNSDQYYAFTEINTLSIQPIDALETVSTDYGEVDDISIYFHIAATSTNDEIGETISYGPIRIDTKAPTNPVLNTDKYSTSRIITLILGATNAIEMYLSNTAHGVGGQWEPLVSPKIWELTEGQGLKTIYVQFRDRADNRTKAMGTLNLDTIPPSVSISSQSQQETNQAEITVDVLFSEPVEHFIETDIFVNNCTVSNLDGADDRYTLKITPSGAGEFSVQIPKNKAEDVAGNGNESSDSLVRIFDPVAPQVSIVSSSPAYTQEPSINVTVSFSESVQSFTKENIQTVNVLRIDSFTQTGNDYLMTLVPENQGAVEMFIPENESFDNAGNGNTLSETLVRNYDSVSPSISITSNTRDTTNISPIPITITFNENIKGFESTDIVTYGTIINFYSLDMQDSYAKTFIFDLIPPGQGEISVKIAENAAIDRAGNGNNASEPFIRIYDLTQPDVYINTEINTVTNQSSIACTATFSSPVENLESDDIQLTNALLQGSITGSDKVFSFNISPQNEGEVTILIPEDTVFSKSGNTNRKSNVYQLIYDVSPPLFELQSIENYATNQSPIPITLVCNELINELNKADIQTQGVGDIINFSVNDNLASFDVLPDSPGILTIQIQVDAFSDLAGNANAMTQMLQIEYDVIKPTVSLTSSTSTQVAESPIPVSIVFSEPVIDFTLSDLSITNAEPSNLQKLDTQDGFTKAFRLDLVPSNQGEVFLTVPSDIAMDRAGNANQSSETFERIYSSDRPTVSLTSSSSETTDITPIPIEILFSTNVTGFEASDILVTNGLVDQFSGADTQYNCVIKPASQGQITVDIPADAAQDAASFGNVASAQLIRIYDYNDVPVAYDNSFSLNEDSTGTFILKASDSDESDNLTYTVTTQPQDEFIYNAVTGELSYTPEADFSGQRMLTFVASDGKAESNIANITITVNEMNDVPELVEPLIDQTIDEDAPFEYTIENAFNDIDVNDVLSYSAKQTNGQALPSWLTFDAMAASFSGIPTNDDVGQIHIKVKASDLSGADISDTFSLTVNNMNDLPEIVAESSFELDENKSIQAPLTISDVDSTSLSLYITTDKPDLIAYTGVTFAGQGLVQNQDATYSILPGPSGTAQLTMTIVPVQNQFGTAQLNLWLSDENETISSVVSVNVQAVRFTIAGKSLYYKGDSPVSNVNIVLNGNKTYETTTDTYGHYTFSNIPTGDYTLEASRNVDTLDESISPMDASIIARSIVLLEELDCYELIAADVSRNGDTSAMDTSLVARLSAGLITEFDPENVHWAFVSEPIVDCSSWSSADVINDYNIEYNSKHTIIDLQSDHADVDFIAIRLGDVTGNWPDNHMRKRSNRNTGDTLLISGKQGETFQKPIISSKSQTIAALNDVTGKWPENHIRKSRKKDDPPFLISKMQGETLQIPVMQGETLQIPVVLSKSYTIAGLEIEIQYNPENLRLIGMEKSQTILADIGFQLLETSPDGESILFHYSTMYPYMNEIGNVLVLNFEVLNNIGKTSVNIVKYRINETFYEVKGGFTYHDMMSYNVDVYIHPNNMRPNECLIDAIRVIQELSTGQSNDLLTLLENLKICSGIKE
jgi:hypothetical protein